MRPDYGQVHEYCAIRGAPFARWLARNVAPLRPENITLVALPEGVVIEHKTPGGSRRENFCSPFQIVMVLLNRFTHCTKSAAWRACNQSLLTKNSTARPRSTALDILSLFWGDPTPYVERAHAAGVKVFHQVGSVAEAQRAAAAGVDVIVAQGVKAGGHVAGEVSTLALVPRVVDAVAPRPVVAAGGIADARGVVAVLALGAQAAVLGTRFLASSESRAHPHYKQKVLEASEQDTVRTTLFGYGWPDAPHRTLRTAFVRQWLGQEARGQESRPDEPVVGQTVIGGQPMPVLRFMGFPPNSDASGDIESMDLLAGQAVGLVREVKPAGQIVRELVEEARQIISQRLTDLVATRTDRS
jgi:NAD(P)H-dependent flavin oxidoreductase YrpB (nitropropane dioxygenase family)